MPKHLVFVGGGHAHRTALMSLRDTVGAGHRVTLIGPSPYHYYSGLDMRFMRKFQVSGELRESREE